MPLIKVSDIKIADNRQRKEFEQTSLVDLANSISSVGLIHPIVVRRSPQGPLLVAGERRLKALDTLWAMGSEYTFGGIPVHEGYVPATFFEDLDDLSAMEIELEENIRRVDITWQERCEATVQLVELRKLQAEKQGLEPPSPQEVGREIYPDHHPSVASDLARKEVILAKHLKDPEVASAKTLNDGFKIIRRKEEAARNAALGEAVGRTYSASIHSLLQGNCIELMQNITGNTFDVILTDPPYGIDAQNFNDSGGKADAAGHQYDDSYMTWQPLMAKFLAQAFRLAKPQAHLYCFCDVERFAELKFKATQAGWKVFRTPFIWHNPSGQRAPWPQSGPHRKYQMLLYATKGERPVLKLSPDLVTYASDENLGWAAQKPVDLYTDLLSRSCRAGDSVLDPFCGSGTIFPAAHRMKLKATGIEADPVAYGIAVKRLEDLK